MVVADTHAFVSWLDESKKLSSVAATALRTADRVLVSAMSLWEISMLVDRGRLRFDRDAAAWIEQACRLRPVEIMPVTPAIAVRAPLLRELRDPADQST